jgi:hypothetical protein
MEIPSSFHSDGAEALTLGNWKDIAWKYHRPTTETELYSPWQNRAESGIRELKRYINQSMRFSNAQKFCEISVAYL